MDIAIFASGFIAGVIFAVSIYILGFAIGVIGKWIYP
jgi:small basic protein